MTQHQNNDRFTSPLGLNDDGKPWKEEDIPWEFDKDGMIVMKKIEVDDSGERLQKRKMPRKKPKL